MLPGNNNNKGSVINLFYIYISSLTHFKDQTRQPGNRDALYVLNLFTRKLQADSEGFGKKKAYMEPPEEKEPKLTFSL
uniref:Uncharacterized protein n=1 Tax=uncultured organism MedDCM-OCT-S04-C12 TaxID=743608 RepID=D6PJ14_9ZZZZ|nr:hypothetical protein [uncultured organism MedDCM-OCT-S04-C12]